MRRPRCAAPGCDRPSAHRHHVALEQHLTRAQARDPRAIIRLCFDCHLAHHARSGHGSRTLPVSVLTEANWEFLHEVFPGWAEDYVRRYYRAEG